LKPADAVSRVIPFGSIFSIRDESFGFDAIFCAIGFSGVAVDPVPVAAGDVAGAFFVS
jgi:hypothetical protein